MRGRCARLGVTFSGSGPEVALSQQAPKRFITDLVTLPEIEQRTPLRRQTGSVRHVVPRSGALPRLRRERPGSLFLFLSVTSILEGCCLRDAVQRQALQAHRAKDDKGNHNKE